MNRENSTPWNVIVVVADTVRPKFLGCYGNEWMQTPCIDQFAQESIRFTRAHPECLPTIPTRRTLHSGRRAFPFNDYQPVPWDPGTMSIYLSGEHCRPQSGAHRFGPAAHPHGRRRAARPLHAPEHDRRAGPSGICQSLGPQNSGRLEECQRLLQIDSLGPHNGS